MHLQPLLYLSAVTCIASALWIKPAVKSSLNTRSDPTITNGNESKRLQRFDDALLKRAADPVFFLNEGDLGNTPNGDSKKQLLTEAFPDIYTLVWVAINRYDGITFNRWFDRDDKDKVLAVLRRIIDDPSTPIDEVKGNDKLRNFFITAADTQAGSNNDLCAKGAAGYTKNYNPTIEGDDYAVVHFCDAAFVDEPDDDGNQEDVPQRLADIPLEDFRDPVDNVYRVTKDMESVAVTILHEIIHFNTIGEPSGLPDPGDFGARIGDEGGDDPAVDYGDPKFAASLRAKVVDGENPPLNNADSYVWYALENYWRDKFYDQLGPQGYQFFPPK